MPEPARSGAGYRRYGPAELATLLRIRRLRSLGFGVEHIRVLLPPDQVGGLGAELELVREELTGRLEALRATVEAIDRLRDEVNAGERGAYDTLAPTLRFALAAGEEPDETPLLERLRQQLDALRRDPAWPPTEERLHQLRDAEEPPPRELERLAAEIAELAPWDLIPDDLVDAVLPTVLLGARFSPAQLAVLHRAAQLKRRPRRRSTS
jgi:DNA-binding transcriptional MerR regulator